MKKRYFALVSAVVGLALVATGCVEDNVSARSDETVCVFDGSERGAQKLKYQIFPGGDSQHKDSDDEVVRIPTSFRFYSVAEDRSVADAGSPHFYVGFAQGNTAVNVEGQFKFRFDPENACEWYARHGRRNAGENGLGFNARSDEAASDLSPWVRWLNENFGTVGLATVRNNSRGYTWPELVYGNDPDGPNRSEESDIAYGKTIGKVFTRRLETSLGGKFFCGTDVGIWGDEAGIDPNCPPIFFEMRQAKTSNPKLMADRAETEVLRSSLQNAEAQATLRKQNAAAQREATLAQQEILRLELQTSRLEIQKAIADAKVTALKDPEIQKCLILASEGLGCDGKRPNTIIAK